MSSSSHSRAARAAYQDLLRLRIGEVASELIGSVGGRARNGRHYLYDKFRIGTEMKTRYLGEATPDLHARAWIGQCHSRQMPRVGAAPGQVWHACCVQRGILQLDRDTGSLLLAFARVGVIRLGGTLVGTAVSALYQGELGVRCDSEDLVQRGDIGFASVGRLSVGFGVTDEERPGDILKALTFDPVPGLPDRQVWKWRRTRGQAMVEVLTSAFGDEGVEPLAALGVSAQGLNYLNYLIAAPIPAIALYRSGVMVQIPRLECFATHKLIVAHRRRGGPDQAKAPKDLGQAGFLIRVLVEDRPDDLRAAYLDTRACGLRWRSRTEASLARLPEAARALDGLCR